MGVHYLSTMLFSLLLLLSVAAVAISAVDGDMINKICQHQKDSEFCFQTLNGDPRAASDMDGLMFITIWSTIGEVEGTADNITYLLNSFTDFSDHVMKVKLTGCQENYVNVLFWFKRAFDSAVARSYYDIFYLMRKGWFEASVCEYSFKFEPIRTSPLTARYDLLLKHAELAYAVIQQIIGPKSKLQDVGLFKPLPVDLN